MCASDDLSGAVGLIYEPDRKIDEKKRIVVAHDFQRYID